MFWQIVWAIILAPVIIGGIVLVFLMMVLAIWTMVAGIRGSLRRRKAKNDRDK